MDDLAIGCWLIALEHQRLRSNSSWLQWGENSPRFRHRDYLGIARRASVKRNRTRKPPIGITITTVRALPLSEPGKKHFQWDREVRGFGAYRTSGGQVMFVYHYRMPYQRARRVKVGQLGEMTPAQAREIARTWAYERRQGVDPIEKRRAAAREAEADEKLKLGKYTPDYLERVVRIDVAGLLADIRIDQLRVDDVDQFLQDLSKRSKSAQNMGLIYLKVLINDAKRRGTITSSEAFSMFLPPQVVNIMERQQPDLRRRIGFVFTFDSTRSTVVSTQAKNTLDANIHRRMELAMALGSVIALLALVAFARMRRV
ncbi:Arm DNA-binding domain-containing protein [Sphingomonas asaccharolytica]|uniref:Arm DNA-binding domain-containing protein n=1 Tax=Sphingomonas asaccharolytica TaxID=40681 RepID=UPI000A060897|nr:Arm DNA-binding domain-containing protein [Sphingomonas asaccharolytica]